MRPLSSSSRIARSLFVAALVAWGASSTVRSADIVKDNNPTGIANASSWVGGALPTPTDTIVFNDVLVQTASFGTGAALTVYGLRVEGTLTNLVNISNTANANFLELREGGLTLAGGLRSLTVAGLKADVNQTWNLGANTLTVGGSRLQGAGTVSVIGTGELIVGANNIMTKGFDITGVRLTASVANSLSNQANVVHTIHATGQAYLNGAGITYVRGFNLAGTGWARDATPLGALRLENGAIASGNISLIGDTRITAYQSTGTLSGIITESGGARALELGVTNDTGVLTLAGTVNLTGGTTVRGGTVRLGVNDVFADTNALTINGGTLDLAGANDTISTLTIASGTLANTGAAAVLSATTLEVHSGNIAATLGGGRLTKTTLGTTTVTAVQAYTGGTQIDSGVLALDGTDLLVLTGEVLINGGTLDISGHNNHVGALTLTSGSIINSGGAAALTAASYEVHSGQVDAVLAGVGIILVKNTAGTVTLTGANTYTGLTTVNAGTLNVTTLHAGGGAFTVGGQGTLGVALSTAGGSLVASTLTLEGGALSFDIGTFLNPGAGFPILDVGTFTLGAASTINLSGSALALGQFSLLSYDTFNGNFADLLLGTLPARTLAELVNNTGAKTIDINITGVDVPRWTGLVGNAWDVNSTQNWRLVSAGTTTTYLEGPGGTDSVLFDETATSTTVQLTTAVSPISTTVDNTNKTYTFTGAGGLNGTGALTKNGTGLLILSNTGANGFSGGLVVNNGTVQLGDGVTTGTGQPGTGIISLGATGRLEFFLAPGQDFGLSNVIQGSGTIVQKGNNTVTLTAGNSGFSGSILVTLGTLKAGYDGAFGTATVEVQQNGTLDTTGYEVGNNILLSGGKVNTTAGLTNALNGGITLGGGGSFNISTSAQLALNGVISGSGGFNKLGAGALLVAGNNTFTGVTTLEAGLLRLAHAKALGAAGTGNGTVVKSAATLDLAGYGVDESIELQGGKLASTTGNAAVTVAVTLTSASTLDASAGASITLQGAVDGAGSLAKTGAGRVTLQGSNSYAGGTVVSGGSIVFANAAALPTTGVITAGAGTAVGFGFAIDQALLDARLAATTNAFALALGTSTANNFNLTGYTNVSLGAVNNVTYSGALTTSSANYLFGGGGGELTVASNLSGAKGVTIGAGGTVILSGNNTHVGTNTVSSGLLRLGSSTALGSAANALVLQYTAGFTTTVDLNGYDIVVGGLSGPQNPAGLVQITDNSSAPGTTRLTANIVTGSTTFGSWLRDGANGRKVALVKTGAGTLVLNGATNTVGGHTFTGGLYLNQGLVDVRVNVGGALPTTTDIYFTGTSTLQASNNGGAAVSATATANSVHFEAGLGTITHAKTNASANSLFTFNGTATRSLGAAGNFAFSGVAATDVYNYSFSDFFLPADEIFNKGIYFGGSAFAAIDIRSGYLRGLDYIGDSALGDTVADTNTANALLAADSATLADAAGTSVTGKDLQLTGTGNITGQGSETLNTLKIASHNSITLGAGAVFSVDSILKTGGSLLIPGSPTAVPPVPEVPAVLSYSEISGGEGLTVADEDSDFIVRVNLAVDTLKISSKLLDSIQNGLTKSGQGLLILSNNNAYFGVTNILEGVVQIGHANALGALGAVNRTRVHAGAVLDIVGVSLGEELELLNGGTVGNSSTSAAGTLTGLITLNNGGTLHAVSGAVLNVQSIISGNGGITHTGLGRTLLLSDNLFTGNVNIEAGSLVITKQANLGAGAKVVRVAGGGTSTLEPTATAVLPRFDLDGTSGNITLDQSITYQLSSEGGATVPSGIVNIAGDNVLKGRISLVNGGGGQGRLYVQAGKLTIDGNIDAEGATANRTIFLGGTVNGEGVVNGIISDTVIDTLTTRVVTVAKDGANTWTLNGNNTFTGNLQVTDGVLKFNSASALGSAAGSIVLGVAASTGTEAILQYIGASDAIIARAFSYGNNSGTALGVIRNTSGHLLTLQGAISRNNNWARTVVFQGGQFLVTGAITGNNVGSHTVIDGATVTFTNTTNSYGTNNSATNGANTIVKNGGILKNGASEVLPNSTFVVLGDTANNSAGTYDLNGYNETVRGLSHEGTGTALVTNSAASGVNTLIVTGTSTYSGVIADGATAQTALTKSTGGVLTLSGINTYTGPTNVTGGTLAITTTGILNSKVTVATGATLDLLGTVKIGGVDSAGALRIGSGGVTGTATIEGALNTTTGSILYFDLGGGSRGATTGGYDAINGLTSLNLTGTLSVSLVAGFVPTENAVFNLIDWTQLGSTFTNSGYAFDFLSADVSALGLKWDTDSFSTTGSIYLVAVPEPGRGLLLVMALGWLVAGRRKKKG